MKNKNFYIVLIITLIMAIRPIFSQSNNYYIIQLKNRVFIPEVGFNEYFDQVGNVLSKRMLQDKIHALIQFYFIPDENKHLELRNYGIILHDYIPNMAFTASVAQLIPST